MLAFDPSDRITVPEALEHPWLTSYHDISDEPDCPQKFERWREIEKLNTLEEFREALWNEIEDYRKEVRAIDIHSPSQLFHSPSQLFRIPSMGGTTGAESPPQPSQAMLPAVPPDVLMSTASVEDKTFISSPEVMLEREGLSSRLEAAKAEIERRPSMSPDLPRHLPTSDPVTTYVRRSSILQPSRRGSTYNSPVPSSQQLPSFVEGYVSAEPSKLEPTLAPGSVVFPTQGFVVPARSRTGSTVGGEVTRKLLRTLSTVSIHESVEGLAGGLAGIAPIGKYITAGRSEADAPPSEMPRDFGIGETSEGEEEDSNEKEQGKHSKEKPGGRFQLR